jgi:hypothetical protein
MCSLYIECVLMHLNLLPMPLPHVTMVGRGARRVGVGVGRGYAERLMEAHKTSTLNIGPEERQNA